MKTALKIVLGFAAVLLLMIVTTRYFLAGKLDGFIRQSIVQEASRELETEVDLESISVSIPRASATLKGLRIGNPEGYSDNFLLYIGTITVDIDMSTINDDVLVIQEVAIEDPQVNYEINDRGVSNLDVLEKRLGVDKHIGGPPDDTRLIIDRLDFRGGRITASAALKPGEVLEFDFPVIFMNGIGEPDGASPEQIGTEINTVLVDRIISAAKRAGVDQLIEAQKERLLDKAREKLDEKIGDKLGEFLKKKDGD